MSYLTGISLYLTFGVCLTIWALHDWDDPRLQGSWWFTLMFLCLVVVLAPLVWVYFVLDLMLGIDADDGRPPR